MVHDQGDEYLRRRRQVGARIRQVREGRDLSQEKLAELAGLSRVTVVRMELAIQSPRLDHLFRVADALGVPLSQLVRD